MSKIIIHNKSNLSDTNAINYAWKVVLGGRISGDNDRYCYCSVFARDNGDKIAVYAKKNKASDTFVVENIKEITVGLATSE